MANFAYLAYKALLHVFSPDEPAGTVLIGALLQAGELLAPFPDEQIEPHQLGLEGGSLTRFAIRRHTTAGLY